MKIKPTRIGGIVYHEYNESRIEAFMERTRREKMLRKLTEQLETAERRGFAATKVTLPTLRWLLSLVA